MTTKRYLDQRLRMQMLRCLDALDAQGSVLKAAAALGVSQPALTKTLQDLEDIVATRLFERHSRGVRATEAGEVLVLTARRVLAELRRADEALDQLEGPGGGTVAIGALPVAAGGVLPGALARLRTSFPAVRVRLQQGRTEDMLPLLLSGEIDLIVGRLYEPAVPDGLLREALWDEPIAVLARTGHPLFELAAVQSADLLRYDMILPTISQRVGQEIEHILAQLGGDPEKPPLRSASYGLIREMLHDSDMISLMPGLLLVGDLLRGTLRKVKLPVPPQPRPAGLIQRPGHDMPPAAAAFITSLRGFVADINQRGLVDITGADRPDMIGDKTGARAKP